MAAPAFSNEEAGACFLRAGDSMTIDRRIFLGGAVAMGATAAAPALAWSGGLPDVWARHGAIARSGGQMHYATLGDPANPAVVLLPKLGGWIADWRHVAPRLAEQYYVIAIDPPGHGGSRFLGHAPYVQTLAESASAVLATLTSLGIQRFFVVGNSLGGCIGVMLAASWPEAVAKLGLVSTALYGKQSLADIRIADQSPRPGNYDADWNPLPRTLDRTAKTFGMTPQINEELNQSRAVAGKWVRASERGVMMGGVAAALPRIKAPTLLVYGSSGSYLKYQQVARERMQNPRIVTLAAKGSFVHQELPEETARVLLDFLAEA